MGSGLRAGIYYMVQVYGSFRKLGVPYFGVLIYKDPSFLGILLGSPICGNSHICGFSRFRIWGVGGLQAARLRLQVREFLTFG